MKHAITSIFKAATGVRNSARDVQQGATFGATSSPMLSLTAEQLRFVVGGDGVEPDGLPKGGWKATGSTSA